MATITATSLAQAGIITPTVFTLGASDTLTYTPGVNGILVIQNGTASAVTTLNIDGDGGTTVPVPDTGSTFSVASGLTFPSIAAGDFRVVRLDTIKAYLQGTVTISGGSGMKAFIIQ